MRTPMRLAAVAAVAVAAAVALAGCSSVSTVTPMAAGTSVKTPASLAAQLPKFPVTVTAANGHVRIKNEPKRIVSLDATSTEDLYAVGAGDQVVAVDQDSDFPPGAPTTSLSGLTPNIEAIAKYHPSLVIAAQNSNGLVSGMAKLGIPVLIEPPVATVNDVYRQIEQIGHAVGHDKQADNVVSNMSEQIKIVVRRAGRRHANLTYYWELTANPYHSATSATFIGDILGLFGLKNIADAADKPADGGHPELSQEYIVTARPNIIFLADNQSADGGQTPAMVAERPGWAGLPAVKNHQIFGLNDGVASRWGPRLPQLVAAIADAIEHAKA